MSAASLPHGPVSDWVLQGEAPSHPLLPSAGACGVLGPVVCRARAAAGAARGVLGPVVCRVRAAAAPVAVVGRAGSAGKDAPLVSLPFFVVCPSPWSDMLTGAGAACRLGPPPISKRTRVQPTCSGRKDRAGGCLVAGPPFKLLLWYGCLQTQR